MIIKEFPCTFCITYNKDIVCECSELQNYNNYQQGRVDAYKDVLEIIEAGVCDYCKHEDLDNKCFNKCTHELEALKEWVKEKE